MPPLRLVLRSAVTRFLPGALASLGSAFFVSSILKPTAVEAGQLRGFTTAVILLAVGYVAGATLLRSRLRGHDYVNGGRPVLAGFVAPLVLLGLGLAHGSPVAPSLRISFTLLAGIATTLVIFAPIAWARRRLSGHGDDSALQEARARRATGDRGLREFLGHQSRDGSAEQGAHQARTRTG